MWFRRYQAWKSNKSSGDRDSRSAFHLMSNIKFGFGHFFDHSHTYPAPEKPLPYSRLITSIGPSSNPVKPWKNVAISKLAIVHCITIEWSCPQPFLSLSHPPIYSPFPLPFFFLPFLNLQLPYHHLPKPKHTQHLINSHTPTQKSTLRFHTYWIIHLRSICGTNCRGYSSI